MKPLEAHSPAEVEALLDKAVARQADLAARELSLDLTRGKPATEQLDLANVLDGILQGDFRAADGTDTRNYGNLLGLAEVRALGAAILDARPERVLAGGNSSLTLMYLLMETAQLFGLDGQGSAWKDTSRSGAVRFLCPVPGYDRHFAICEQLGIEMLPVAMNEAGPDMDAVETAIAADPDIRGIWCVPKYSNPSGIVYSDETVTRLARLGQSAGPGFRVFWDNAYAVHDLHGPRPLASLMAAAEQAGTAESVALFASTSKVTWAGAGVAFLAAGPETLEAFAKRLGAMMIGPDKVNQLRHARAFPDLDALGDHMERLAELIRPKFAATLAALEPLGELGIADWTRPDGGYFVSVDVPPGLASTVVRMAGEAGVKLTPAGATWPYGRDPENKNIRLAPTFPDVAEVQLAMEVFVNTVILAACRQQLGKAPA